MSDEIIYNTKGSEREQINGKYREYIEVREDGEEVYAGSDIRDLVYNKIPDDNYIVGFEESDERGLVPIVLPIDADRHTHGAMGGESGAGKSAMIQNILVQLAHKGHGICFVDAKKGEYGDKYDPVEGLDIPELEGTKPPIGEDSLKLLKRIPEHRYEDVIYVNAKPLGGYSINFNPLELPDIANTRSKRDEFAQQHKDMVKDVIKNLGDNDEFGAKMKQVFDNLVTLQIRSDINHHLGDTHYMIQSDEDGDDTEELQNSIKKFAELENLSDEWLKSAVDKVSEIDDTDAIERRTSRLVDQSPTMRSLFANPSNDIDLSEVLSDEKILIVDVQISNEAIQSAFISYILESLRLLSESVNINKEFFTFVDEFQKIYSGSLDSETVKYDTWFRQGRSNNMLFFYGTQSPRSLEGFVEDRMTNTNVALSGSLTGDDVREFSPLFTTNPRRPDKDGVKGADEIADLNGDEYEFAVRTPKENVTTVKSLPPLPPVRTTKEAVELALWSCSPEGYGSEHSYYDSIEETVKDQLLEDMDSQLSMSEEVQIIDTAIRYNRDLDNEYTNVTPKETIETIIEHAVPSVDTTDYTLSERLEKLENSGYIESENIENGRAYSITETGREDKLSITTGKSGSGGKSEHRGGLSKIRRQLAEYGIYVKLPDPSGNEDIADGIARQFDDENSPFPVENGELFRIEYEKSTTKDKAYKMQKNLAKADNEDLVVLASENPDICEKIDRIIQRGGYKRHDSEKGDILYTKDANYHLSQNGVLPLREIIAPEESDAGHNRWYISGDEVTLYEKTAGGDLTPTVTLPKSLDWDKEDFPAYAVKKKGWQIYKNGELVGTYDSKKEIKEQTNFRKVIKPWIPDVEFEGGDISNHDYMILLVDTPSKLTDEPQIRVDDEGYIPLSEFEPEENTDISNEDTESNSTNEETVETDNDSVDDEPDDDEFTDEFLNL